MNKNSVIYCENFRSNYNCDVYIYTCDVIDNNYKKFHFNLFYIFSPGVDEEKMEAPFPYKLYNDANKARQINQTSYCMILLF